MEIGNPCLMEQTRQTERSTAPMPKAAPMGGETRFRFGETNTDNKVVEAADQPKMEQTMTEMEHANIAVDIKIKKVHRTLRCCGPPVDARKRA